MTIEEAREIIEKSKGCRNCPDEDCIAVEDCHLCKYCYSDKAYNEAVDVLLKAIEKFEENEQ